MFIILSIITYDILCKYIGMGIDYAEDDKLETLYLLQKALFLNEYLAMVNIGMQNSIYFSETRKCGNRPFHKLKIVQAAKVIQTRRCYSTTSKSNEEQPRDLIASDASENGALNSTIKNNRKSSRNDSSRNDESITFKNLLANRVIIKGGNKEYIKLYQVLGDKEYLEECYKKIKSKPGTMSIGSDDETLDGFNQKTLNQMSELLLSGKYKFRPVKRIEIPKEHKPGLFRHLGIGSPLEKIVQVGISEILKHIYEPLFLDCSHGYRPKRSVKTALGVLYKSGGPYSWVIQGDIKSFFDKIPHDLILDLLGKRIKDVNFLTYIRRLLKAGYIDPKTGVLVKTNIGIPQGSTVSPILSNIVLHEFDDYVINTLKPQFEVFEGARDTRKGNKEYD
ncbi:hypothetical protein KL936_005426 [Ogataea polymorpha]|nr:hypothetical protein KL936_005426 [Ogataea polymorpha]